MGARLTAVLLCLAPLTAPASSPEGVWLNERGTVAVRLQSADGEVNGRIVWLRQPFDEAGRPKRDPNNPEPALRERTLCGLPLMRGFRAEGGRWVEGRVYNPRDGKTYRARFEMADADTLVMRGFVLLPVFGDSVTWIRRHQPPGPCPRRPRPGAEAPPAGGPEAGRRQP